MSRSSSKLKGNDMSITRIICPNGCGLPIAFCDCKVEWTCPMCQSVVKANAKGEPGEGKPESNYWLPDMREVFCSAECSLQYHRHHDTHRNLL